MDFTYSGGGLESIPDDAPDWVMCAIEEGDLFDAYDLGILVLIAKTPKGEVFVETDRPYTQQELFGAKYERTTSFYSRMP